ncbi:DUF2536 family protein [Cytobacillus sp. IB215665]|uniref:DUF2536 family protein n=1 Tax=Cytobacillus sp. IB215665 TaxID=3097357 RepID=UPI002A0F218D|nr:DUF2536 family protein [Cytobacillus sp. IB215665]MDX8364122.1 DUF2536 family protein [Cytobacillus sp. IB215665]
MDFSLDILKDKVEFFEAQDLATLEKKVNEQIEVNKAILLELHHISHQMQFDQDGRRYFSAVVHFKRSN